MSGFRRLLVPIGFRHHDDQLLYHARALVDAGEGEVHILHVIDKRFFRGGGFESLYESESDRVAAFDSVQDKAKAKLDEVCERARAMGLTAECHVTTGSPGEEIAAMVSKVRADCIVMGTHGRSRVDRMLLGSNYFHVIRLSSVPVLGVRQPEREAASEVGEVTIRRVLVPCDLSEFSRKAVHVAAEMCRHFGASLLLAHVVPSWEEYSALAPSSPNRGEDLAANAKQSLGQWATELDGLPVEVLVGAGDVVEEIARIAQEQEVDLLVMATHSRSEWERLFIGTITDSLVRLAQCPVMTMRPDANSEKNNEPALTGKAHRDT